MTDYNLKLKEFVERITEDQRAGYKERWPDSDIHDQIYAYFESGRKFDKIIIVDGGSRSVRYFVDRQDGTIYGARSRLAPNVKWYYGTLDTSHLWNWSDFHGRPINDESVRVVGQYGPYTHYAPR